MIWHLRMTSISNTDSSDSDSLLDSTAAKSRISLTRSRRYHPAVRIRFIHSVWVSVSCGFASFNNCANPRTAFSGVRSSWLMLERNSDFAALAASAAACESLADISSRARALTSSSRANLSCRSLSTKSIGCSRFAPFALTTASASPWSKTRSMLSALARRTFKSSACASGLMIASFEADCR